MDLYAENILDHYKHPRHAGTLSDPDAAGEEKNLSCGDEVRVEVRMDGGTVAAVGWTGTGCAISQAGMSMLSEEIIGKTPAEIRSLGREDVFALLGVPIGIRREKCALLGLLAAQKALRSLA